MPADTVSVKAQELERIQSQLRWATNALVSVDGFSRWGPQDDEKQVKEIEALAQEASSIREQGTKELQTKCAELHAQQSPVLAEWAQAKILLHEQYIAEHATDTHRTNRFVRNQEIEAWKAFMESGEPVHENPCWGSPDLTLYQELFGFSYYWSPKTPQND